MRPNGQGRPRRGMKTWAETVDMDFGATTVNVEKAVRSRSALEVRQFIRENTGGSDPCSFSRIISFDTECSVNYADHCEMCSFGYAEFDLEGNKLAEEEIYIKARPAKGRLKEKCQADPEMYVNAPIWKEQYPKIRKILTRPDTVYIAHSCKSDIGFLMQMNRGRSTNQFYFRVFDTLGILQDALPNIGKYNLPYLADTLGIEHDSHVSLSDAIVCFRVLEEVADMSGKTVKEMLTDYVHEHLFDSMDVLRDNYRIELRHQLEDIRTSSRGNPVQGPLTGKRFAATKKMEKEDPEAMLAFARTVLKHGGEYVSSLTVANIFMWDGDKDSGDYAFAKGRKQNLKILRIDQILDGRYGKFPEVCENLRMLSV